MSSTDTLLILRDLIQERLTAAAEDIFTHVERIVVEHEEEMIRQRKLLEKVWKTKVLLRRIELPQQNVYNEEEEEVLSEQQLWNQERNSSLDQEEPESLQIDEEEEEICSSQEQEQQLDYNEESDHVEPEPDTDHQLLSAVADSRDQTGSEPVEENVAVYKPELNPQRRLLEFLWKAEVQFHHIELPQHHVYDEEEVPTEQERDSSLDQQKQEADTFMLTPDNEESDHMELEPDTDHQLLSAVAESQDQTGNMRNITGETRENVCKICKKHFKWQFSLKCHKRIHTGEKPYPCETCGKSFRQIAHLNIHTRTHTGEKPHVCNICEKRFAQKGSLSVHMRIHTGKEPYSCETCGLRFAQRKTYADHRRIHTGEKPFSCETCGRCFRHSSNLVRHRKLHAAGKSHMCHFCQKCFPVKRLLTAHMRTHGS